jgi:hypothetical protein
MKDYFILLLARHEKPKGKREHERQDLEGRLSL